MFSKHKKQIAFTCEQSLIKDLNNGEGNFALAELKIFTYHNNAIVIIRDYAIIEKGEVKIIQ